MATRKRKVRKLRGSRTMGWGQVGQHRNSGGKGGHGMAGLHKHKWSWTVVYDPDHFGKEGFKPRGRANKVRSWVNVGGLDEIYQKHGGSVEKDGLPLINLSELGYEKLLGGGSVSRAYYVIVGSFTNGAKEKVEAAGGKISTGS